VKWIIHPSDANEQEGIRMPTCQKDTNSLPPLPNIEQLTLPQKVAQILCPFFSTHRLLRENEPVALERFAEQYGIGWVHIGRGNLPKTQKWIERIRSLSMEATGIPTAFCGDCEQGLRHTFQCGSSLPWQMAIGATEQAEYAEEIGRILGQEARALGLDVVFGPCVDINDNPDNKVIASRSFGSTAEQVARMSEHFVKGLQQAGVAATLKHFPGHGTSTEDSHLSLPEDPSSYERFLQHHLVPFRACVQAGAMAMMTAHLYARELDPSSITTVSSAIMTDLVRQELAFEGVLFTDSLNMAAINQGQSKRKACVDSLIAGCDVLVHPAQADRMEPLLQYILRAMDRGVLLEETIDRAVTRVLALKQVLLSHQQPLSTQSAEQLYSHTAHQERITTIAQDSITLCTPAPFAPPEGPVTLVTVVDSHRKKDIPQHLPAYLQSHSPDSSHVLLVEESSLLDVALFHQQLLEAERPVVLALLSPMMWFKGRSLLSHELQHKLSRLLVGLDVHTAISFGSPYILHHVPGTHKLCAYGPSEPALQAGMRALFLAEQPTGTLPVPWPIEAANDETLHKQAA
jgi:beta-N-acetylhexosaminidase